MAFPRAWQEYGERYVPALAQGLDFLGPLHHLTQNLFEELALAIREGRREPAFDAAGVPYRIATSAADLGATALVRDMLRLQVEGYRLASDATGQAVTELRATFGRHLIDFCSYFVSPRLQDDALTEESREQAAESMSHAFRSITELLRVMLERRDLQALRDLDSEWSEVLRFWDPEERVDLFGEDPSEHQGIVELKATLLDLRTRLRLGLAIWALLLLGEQMQESQYAQAFLHFAGHFGSLGDVLAVGDVAFGDAADSPPWHDWILFSRAERSGFVDTTTPALRALLILVALRTEPGTEQGLPPETWLHEVRDQLLRALDSLIEETGLAEALGIDQWAERLAGVRVKIEAATEAREELIREEIADARADPGKVGAFQESTRAGWAKHRLGYAIQDAHGQAVLNEGAAPEIVWGHSAWMPKTLFLPDRHSDLHFAEDLGRSVADGEMERFVDALGRLEPLPLDMELRDWVIHVTGVMQEDGYEPSICVTPVEWRLRRYFFEFQSPGPEQAPHWVPEGSRHWYGGETLGLLFFNWPRAKPDRLYIVDPTRFSQYKGWTFPDGHELKVDVREFDSEEALDIARRKPEIMADAGESPEARALEMRQHVYLDVRMKFEIEERDTNAARAILLPPDLQRD